jgi:Coenzyme PQQ synthesis protein D (PqqD)
MKQITAAGLPRKREEGLVLDELADEILLYDLERHKAHCLNRTAALVWRHCDGRTPPAEIAHRLQSELDQPFSEELVWLALRQLNTLHLLDESIEMPPPVAGMSRREMVRTLGIAAAVALPLVTSIIAPTPAQASTCIGAGQPCNPNIACCHTGVACTTGTCM